MKRFLFFLVLVPGCLYGASHISAQSEEHIGAEAFFETIQGVYHIESVHGGTRVETASIAMDPELPGTAIVSMPHCIDEGCFDSGNLFPYDSTQVTRNGGVYTLTLKNGGKQLHYEWVEGIDGKYEYRNFQFVGPSGKPEVLIHSLRK